MNGRAVLEVGVDRAIEVLSIDTVFTYRNSFKELLLLLVVHEDVS
jgi:hypothetical protein